MKRCTRCRLWKPDASFRKAANVSADPRPWPTCLHCRTIPPQMPGQHSMPPRPIERIEPSLKATLLRSLARFEREAFVTRGARVIERPYIKTPSGSILGKNARKRLTITRGLA